MKNFFKTLFLLFTIGVFMRCSSQKNSLILTSSVFPLSQSPQYGHDTLPLFNQKVYVMRIYEVADTFGNDFRQKYTNYRTVTKDEQTQLDRKGKLVQTICLVFLDDEQVLYYTFLQNNPDNKSQISANAPQRICLTDTVMERDLTMNEREKGLFDYNMFFPFTWLGKQPIKRHFYHGIYRFNKEDKSIDMEFQNDYSADKKNSMDNRFVKFKCSISEEKDTITIDRVSYNEEDIINQNETTTLELKNIFDSKFNTNFTAIDVSGGNKNVKNEFIYDILTKKIKYTQFSIDGLTEIKDDKTINKINEIINFKFLQKTLPDFKVEQCIMTFSFKTDNKWLIKIQYKTLSGETYNANYTLSNDMNLNFKIKSINDFQIIIIGNKLIYPPDFSQILDDINKKDFKEFIDKLAYFNDYRIRIYEDGTTEAFLENSLVTISLGHENTKNEANKLNITCKLSNDAQIKDIIPEYEFVVLKIKKDEISEQNSENKKITTIYKKYYLNDTQMVFSRYIYRKNFMKKKTNYIGTKTKIKVDTLLFLEAVKPFVLNKKIKKTSINGKDCFYIEEIIQQFESPSNRNSIRPIIFPF
jgi:hypothetical protein